MTHDADTTPHLSRAIALRAHLWLRERHPGARLETAHVALGGGEVACRATITLASGATTTAHGVTDAIQPGSLLVAEDLAVVRAAEQVGWSPVAAEPIVAPDADTAATPAATAAPASGEGTSVIPAATEGAGRGHGQKQLAGKAADLGDPIMRRPAGGRTAGEGRAVKEPAPSWSAELADTSWTAFWSWARERGCLSGEDFESRVGRSIRSLTPKQARELLLAGDDQA